jgi:hypothetical protein
MTHFITLGHTVEIPPVTYRDSAVMGLQRISGFRRCLSG